MRLLRNHLCFDCQNQTSRNCFIHAWISFIKIIFVLLMVYLILKFSLIICKIGWDKKFNVVISKYQKSRIVLNEPVLLMLVEILWFFQSIGRSILPSKIYPIKHTFKKKEKEANFLILEKKVLLRKKKTFLGPQ